MSDDAARVMMLDSDSTARQPDYPLRVLVVGPAWIGDMVMAQSLFKCLRAERPDVQIDVLAPPWSAPLLKRMPEVRETIGVPLGHGQLGLSTRYRLGRELAARNYAQAIVLPRSFKAALIPWFARVPRRTGYRGETRFGLINDMRGLNKGALPQMVQRYVALGSDKDALLPPADVPAPALTVDTANTAWLMKRFGLSAQPPAVGLMPGAEYGPSKQWPPEYYAAVARELEKDNMQVWIFGSEKDHRIGEQVAAGAGINLCGKTQLTDAVDLIARVKVAITNDSGLMHVAAAVGAPVVAIYGSSDPAYTPPLSERPSVMRLGVECSPCFDHTCRYGHYRCLRDLSVAMVLNAARRHLHTPPIRNSGLGSR